MLLPLGLLHQWDSVKKKGKRKTEQFDKIECRVRTVISKLISEMLKASLLRKCILMLGCKGLRVRWA